MMMAPLGRTRKRTLSVAKSASSSTPLSVAPSPALVSTSSAAVSTAIPGIFSPWRHIKIPRSELDLSTTLKCGQSFRWQRHHQELPSGAISLPIWTCVLDHRVWTLQETEDGFQYRTFRPLSSNVDSDSVDKQESDHEKDEAFLQDYFQLGVPLTELYRTWSDLDPNFKAKALLFPGVRILRQDPVENLICFICSSNNNIGRISQMATKLCQKYGAPITVPSEEAGEGSRTDYGFPTIAALAHDGVEQVLRELGFGYRAKYIANTAKKIHTMDHGVEWLYGLRTVPYEEAHIALLTLQGVGPKVADCVCLMSLDKHETIPVDTHVWQIAVRDYKFKIQGKVPKAISPAIYRAVGKHFNSLFGAYSGWAHSVLFAADLRMIEGRIKEEPGLEGLTILKEEADLVELSVLVKDKPEEQTINSNLMAINLKGPQISTQPLNDTFDDLPQQQLKRQRGE